MGKWLAIIWVIAISCSLGAKNIESTAELTQDSLYRAQAEVMYDEILDAFRARDFHKALEINKEQLGFILENFGDRDSLYGHSISSLAVLYRRNNKPEKAFPLYKEAIEHALEIHGPDHLAYSVRLNNLAEYHRTRGEYDLARPLFYKSIESAKRVKGEDHLQIGIYLLNLASLYSRLGQYHQAVEIYENSKKVFLINEKEEGEKDFRFSTVLNGLADAHMRLGNFEKAFPLYMEAQELAEETFGKDHPSYAASLAKLGSFYNQMGQIDKSVDLILEAIEIAKRTSGTNSFQYATRLANSANGLRQLGDLTQALSNILEAKALIEKFMGPNNRNFASAISILADIRRDMGEYDEALRLYTQAIDIIRDNLGEENSIYSSYADKIATLYINHLENYTLAEEYLYKSLEATANSLGTENLHYFANLRVLARYYHRTGRNEEAINYYLKVNDLQLRHLQSTINIGSEREKVEFLQFANYYFASLNFFAYQLNYQSDSLNAAIYQNTLLLNGLATKSMANLNQKITASGDEDLIDLFTEWRNIRSRIAAEYSKPIDDRYNRLDSLAKTAEKWEGELMRKSSAFSDYTKFITWEDVVANLNEEEVAIEFVKFVYDEYIEPTDSTFYAAIILSSDHEFPVFIPLFEEQKLLRLLKRDKSQSEEEYINNLYGSPDKALYELIFSEIEPYLEGKNSIYFAPDGLLLKLNFNAILAPDNTFMAEKYNMFRLWSTGDILNTSIKEPTQSIWLAGGIDYDAEDVLPEIDKTSQPLMAQLRGPVSSGQRIDQWASLPGSLVEVEKIYKKFKGSPASTLLTGASATESAFKNLCGNSPDILHIATHGFFISNTTVKDNLPPSSENRFGYIENPLFRSGLILSGGNHGWKYSNNPLDSEDGILTAFEISNLDLSNTKLAVLSACETGLGEIYGSEGVNGLQRAFRIAGVDHLIMSMWKVPDETTQELMDLFYTNWISGNSVWEAFNSAQKEMAGRYPPFHWGAFVLVGDGKVEEAYATSRLNWPFAIGFGLIVLFLSLYFIKFGR